MDSGPLEQWLALYHLPGMNSRLFHKLVEAFGSPAAVLSADPDVLGSAGLDAATVLGLQAWQKNAARSAPDEQLVKLHAWAALPGHALLALPDEAYPPLLREIPDPPPLLFVRGDAKVLHEPQLAMVGSRTPTAGGRRLARRFASGLGAAGLTITSGLALGIDSESHLGALEGGAATIAVLGSGIDRVFPARNRDLAERIIAGGGALVSEFPLGTDPLAWYFPRRNRIISGLARGVLVVEAALPSGSLITARFALEQGRDVFAIPGSVDNSRARGCHHLIRDGAALVEDPADVLAEFGLAPGSPTERMKEPSSAGPDGVAGEVLERIGYDLLSLDELVALTGLPVGELSAALVQLEILGRIESSGGGYCLRGPRPTRKRAAPRRSASPALDRNAPPAQERRD